MSFPAIAAFSGPHSPTPSSSSRIASGLVTACTTHISATSKLPGDGKKENAQYRYRRDLYHEFGRFELWSRGFYEAPPGTANLLDSVLDGAIYLKEATILLLASLASCLLAARPLRKMGNDHTWRDLASALDEATSAYPRFEETLARELAVDTGDRVLEELREYVDSLFDVLPTLDNVLETIQERVTPAANLVSVVEAVGLTMEGDPSVETDRSDAAPPQNRAPRAPLRIPQVLPDGEFAAPTGEDCSMVVGVSPGGTGDATSTPEVLGVLIPRLEREDNALVQGCVTTVDEIGIPDILQVENSSLEGEASALVGVPGETAAVDSRKRPQDQIGIQALNITEPFITGIDLLRTGDDAALQEMPPSSGEVPDIPVALQLDYSQLLGGKVSAGDNSVAMAGSLAAGVLFDSDDYRSMDEKEEDQEKLERIIQQEPPACPIHITGNHWEIYQQYIRDRFPQAIEGLDIEGLAKGNAQFYEALIRGNEELGADKGVLQAECEDGGDHERKEGEEGEQEEEEGGEKEERGKKGEKEQEFAYEDCELEASISRHLPILLEEPALKDETAQAIFEPTKDLASRGVPATFKDSGLGSSAPGTRPTESIFPLLIQPNMLTPSRSLLTDTLLAPPRSVSALSGSTICSTTSEPKNRRLLPRVPNHSRGSSGFNCTFCGSMQLPTTQGHVWRKHVFADLAPYMCIRSRCRSAGTFYTSKKAWVLHDTFCIRDAREGAGEATTEVCPFCLKDSGRDTGRFYSHVAHHMEDIRLFALPPAFREYEVGEYKDSSGMGSSEHTKGSRGRSPIGVHVAKSKVVDPLATREWAVQAEGNIDVAESTRTVSVSSLESDSESMTRRFRRTLGKVTPAGMKALSGHRDGMGWDERLRSTPGHAPPSRSTSSSEESSVNG